MNGQLLLHHHVWVGLSASAVEEGGFDCTLYHRLFTSSVFKENMANYVYTFAKGMRLKKGFLDKGNDTIFDLLRALFWNSDTIFSSLKIMVDLCQGHKIFLPDSLPWSAQACQTELWRNCL